VTGAGAIEIVDPGLLVTVQDLGRAGHAHLGVPRSGAADLPAHRLANALVGNDAGAATLEATATGCELRVTAPTVVAVTGARCDVWVGHVPAPFAAPVRLAAGQSLALGPAQRGLRSYVAVRGGVDAAAVLGSRATDTLSGLGPAPLRAGDVVALGSTAHADDAEFARLRRIAVDAHVSREGGHGDGRGGVRGDRDGDAAIVLDIAPGPRAEWFAPDALARLCAQTYIASSDSDRIGLRLMGTPIERARLGELPSEGMVLGAVQVPPSGQPVVFLADHPTTGGYPVVGVVDAAGVAAAAQTRPGDAVRFAALEP